ncbi:MAG: SGNH/GDSL hydrolase family protein [Oscillatoriaceae bacterium SKW80]|nr:SGNH/GDSL hydrolase family protein [Oscillatoriaceae bacterium SKYG93]MCX8122054.1 SGNH/GDSL hydrolase family protein [Oscillatoriaceae bacterium SKW80]MDW8454341.1 SGNH/GDSL hydrolase family protein [Oscillatoriaceae cyanobacterium SKYGB_i_bin93]HIK29206.1 SGNH/GDSL hydrolase family protein [Oscillatoriaceae cyanobacterium M7585_C2015_266]
MNIFRIFFTITCVLLIIYLTIEVILRVFGFGETIIYIPDEKIGYIPAPNQRLRRLGNRMEINEYSMRSPPLALTDAATLRVLLLGDSVANGGWWTDEENTISAMLARQITSAVKQKVEVLNASANSWGPRNQLAYLQRFGTFEARAVVLLLNTDDLFATAPTSQVVGRDRNYPNRQPPLAVVEVFSRYLWRKEPEELKAARAEGGDRVARNLDAIRQVLEIASQKNAYFLLAMTPLLREIGEPGPRDYEKQARRRLTAFTQSAQIPYIDFLALFNATSDPKALYRDHIHLSPSGNEFVSKALSKNLIEALLISGSK